MARRWFGIAVVAVLVAAGLGSTLAQDAVNLEYKWIQGDTARYKMTIERKDKQTAGPQTVEATQKYAFAFGQEVKAVGPDGTAVVETRYDAVTINIDVPAQNVHFSFDSANPEDERKLASPLVIPYAAMLGESFSFKVDKKGKILEVTGFDKIVDKAVERYKANPKTAPVADQGKITLSDVLRDQLETMYKSLPVKAPKIGDSWKNKTAPTQDPSGTVQTEITYKLENPEAVGTSEAYKLSYNALATIQPPANPGDAKLTAKNAAGAVWLGKESWRVAKAVADSSMQFEVTSSKATQETSKQILVELAAGAPQAPAPAPTPTAQATPPPTEKKQ
jgi:hypothetical protein